MNAAVGHVTIHRLEQVLILIKHNYLANSDKFYEEISTQIPEWPCSAILNELY